MHNNGTYKPNNFLLGLNNLSARENKYTFLSWSRGQNNIDGVTLTDGPSGWSDTGVKIISHTVVMNESWVARVTVVRSGPCTAAARIVVASSYVNVAAKIPTTWPIQILFKRWHDIKLDVSDCCIFSSNSENVSCPAAHVAEMTFKCHPRSLVMVGYYSIDWIRFPISCPMWICHYVSILYHFRDIISTCLVIA